MIAILERPVRKRGAYVSRVMEPPPGPGRPLRVQVHDTRILGVRTTAHGHALALSVGEGGDAAARKRLLDLDAFALDTMLSARGEANGWFRTGLDEATIRAYFRPSLAGGHTLHAAVSVVRPPVLGDAEDFADFLAQAEGRSVSVELEVQGLYIQPKRFGYRWIVRRMEVNAPEEPLTLTAADRADVEDAWEEDLRACGAEVEARIVRWRAAIARAEAEWADVQELWNEARAATDPGATWNAALQEVAARIAAIRKAADT